MINTFIVVFNTIPVSFGIVGEVNKELLEKGKDGGGEESPTLDRRRREDEAVT